MDITCKPVNGTCKPVNGMLADLRPTEVLNNICWNSRSQEVPQQAFYFELDTSDAGRLCAPAQNTLSSDGTLGKYDASKFEAMLVCP